jgi:hypothetical protein
MGVQKPIRVAEDLEVHPEEGLVTPAADLFDGFPEQIHVTEEPQPLGPRKIGESIDPRTIREGDTVSGQELHIPDRRKTRIQMREHRRITAAQ